MQQLILVTQIIVGVALVAMILLQAKGSGLSAVFGGEGGMYRSRRGVEKLLHRSTILFAFVFVALSAVNLILSK